MVNTRHYGRNMEREKGEVICTVRGQGKKWEVVEKGEPGGSANAYEILLLLR